MSSTKIKFGQKITLTEQVKLSSEKILKSIMVESCRSLTDRLYRMSQNDRKYLR